MASLSSITNFLNKELSVKKIKDTSKNGLQVKGKKGVLKIGFAVDACIETFEKARKQGCDLVIVHHGLFWKKDKTHKKTTDKREAYLKKNKISLYAAHLPLDLHNKYGNNIELARILKLKNVKKFGDYHGIMIGYQGKFKEPVKTQRIVEILNSKIITKSKYFDFRKKKVRTIGIISGGGESGLPEAIEKKLDCFLTGEEHHSSYHYAKEAKISLIFAGHYATETVGVKALMPLLKKKFGVETVFIDVPTGL